MTDTTAMLLPCPFCGGSAEFRREGSGRHSCIVECTECGAVQESGDEGERSGTSWNRRAALAGQADAVPVGYMDPAADFLLPRAGDFLLMSKVEVCLFRSPGGRYTQPLYTTPPAAIPVDALRELVAKWRAETQDKWIGDVRLFKSCADELTALIAPASIGAEAQEGKS